MPWQFQVYRELLLQSKNVIFKKLSLVNKCWKMKKFAKETRYSRVQLV